MVNQPPVPESSPYAWEDRISSALQDSLDDGEYVVQWVAVIEVLDKNGERNLYPSAMPGMKPWDTMGLLDYTQVRERAYVAEWENGVTFDSDFDEDEEED